MIVWICSYPRSGNTLTRKILKDCFDIETYTVHGDEAATEHLFENQSKYDINDPEVYKKLKADEKTYYIKSHYIPLDGSPIIHVVRDGRNAVSSFAKLHGVNVAHVITGQSSGFASWSGHYWGLAGRQNTLLVRFEDLLSDTTAQVDRIGSFIGAEKKRGFVNDFEPVNDVMGSGGKHQAEFSQYEELLFQRCHGVVMGVLGYV